MKKLITLIVAALMAVACCFSLVACGDKKSNARTIDFSMSEQMDASTYALFAESVPEFKADTKEGFKIGFIFLHDEKSTYDLNFYKAAQEAVATMGLKADQVVYKFNVAESDDCYKAAKEMVESGAKAVFADSFGHGSFMAKAAKEFTNVQFYHATGTGTSVADAPANLHNAFASIYVGRYIGGVAAGMKLNEMIAAGKITADQAKVGYVGAFPYAEVKSGYTSFFLGVRSVCPTATMEVKFTNSWYDEVAEKSAAEALIANKCVVISQHADSMGAPTACEKAGVPNISYNGSTIEKCPNTFIVSSRIDWAPYFKAIIASFSTKYAEVLADKFVPANGLEEGYQEAALAIKEIVGKDFTGDMFFTGSVKMSAINVDAMAKGTSAKLYEEIAKISTASYYDADSNKYVKDSSVYIFDCSKFTVKNAKADTSEFSKAASITMDDDGHLTAYTADVKDEINPDTGKSTFVPETEVVRTNGGYYDVVAGEGKAVAYFFSESTFRSAPYFDIDIDGITIIG